MDRDLPLTGAPCCELKGLSDILIFEVRVQRDDLFAAVFCSDETDDHPNCDPHSSNTRSPPHHRWVNGQSVKGFHDVAKVRRRTRRHQGGSVVFRAFRSLPELRHPDPLSAEFGHEEELVKFVQPDPSADARVPPHGASQLPVAVEEKA